MRQKTLLPYEIEVTAGLDQGSVFAFLQPSIKIGRAEDNDIILRDNKCSRYHLLLSISSEGVRVDNISTKSQVMVNGKAIVNAMIKNDGYIQVGETILHLRPKTTIAENTTQLAIVNANLGSIESSSQNNLYASKQNSKRNFYMIVAGVGILFTWLMMQPAIKKKAPDGVRSLDAIEAEIEATKIRGANLQAAQAKAGKNSVQYQEAQASYLKGFRDYREGNYQRAIQSFQASLSLYPDHSLSQKYLDLSQKKLDELIQYYMYLGKHYMEQNKYELAKSAYKNVVILKNGNTQDLVVKEALARFEECDTVIKGAQ